MKTYWVVKFESCGGEYTTTASAVKAAIAQVKSSDGTCYVCQVLKKVAPSVTVTEV